jgi:hypothetical protein
MTKFIVTTVIKITMVTKLDWRFPIQSPRRSETHVDLRVKCPLLPSDFNQNWDVWANLNKKTSVSNFMKIRSIVLELFHA